MEILLLVTVILTTAWVSYTSRDATKVFLFLLGATSIAGILLTAGQRLFGDIPVPLAQSAISLVFLGLIFAFSRKKSEWYPPFNYGVFLPLVSLIVAGVFITAKIVSLSQNPLLFTGIARLAYAEDNAKWLNFSANLAQGNALNVMDGTGGGLAVLMVICGAFTWAVSLLTLGGPSVAGISVTTVLVAHSTLIAAAPLALTPVVTRYFSVRQGTTPVIAKNKALSVYLGLGTAALFVVSAVGAVSTFGHLSLEIVLVQLLFWAAATIYLWESQRVLLLSTVIASSTALIWLPLPPLALAIALCALVVAIVRARKSKSRKATLVAAALLVNLLLVAWLTTPEIQYLSASTQPSTSTHLVFAEGGTMAIKRFEMLLLLVTGLGVIFYIWSARASYKLKSFFRGYPILLMIGFSAAVMMYDFIIARDGWPHYGARKLTYLVVIVCITVLLPIAFQGYQAIFRKNTSVLMAATALSVVAIMMSQTFAQVSYSTFKREVWINAERRLVNGEPSINFWAEKVNAPNSIDRKIESYPIACVQATEAEIKPGINDAYFCTRILMSLHGAENYTNALFYPILTAPTAETIRLLKNLPENIQQLKVLVLDEKGNVRREISMSEYIDLYAQQSKKTYRGLQ